MSTIKFNIGDKVSFLNEEGGGIIVKILSKNTLLVQIEEGFEIPYNINEVLSVKKQSDKTIPKKEVESVKEVKKASAEFSKKDIREKKVTKKVELEIEIDLHIEELIDDTRGMTSGEKLEIQINRVQRELEKAILNKQTRKITFIHGVGVGRLKQEIYKILKTYDHIRFYDAPYRKYGFGATEVVIR